MRSQQIFWDFDGTLVDTYPGMVAAFHQALVACRVNDFEIDDDDVYRTMRQHSLGTALQRFSAEYQLDQDRLAKIYQRKVAPMLSSAQPFKGAKTILASITAAGGRNFLLTHRDAQALDRLDELNLKQYFTGFVTASDNYPRKPDPTSLQALCRQFDVDPQAALMVGDRTLDVTAGHRAGMAGALFDLDHLIVADSQPEFRTAELAELQAWLLV